MPTSLSRSTNSYGKRRADSNPHLVTIGGGSRQSKMKWNQWGMPRSRLADDDDPRYGVASADIEMGPRTTVTATRATDRPRDSMSGSGKSAAGGGAVSGATSPRAGDSRDSDEYPIMGISKTTQVQWTVENVSDSKSG